MGLIKRLLEKSKENKSEFKEKMRQSMEERKIERLISERELSSDERELISHQKEKRAEQVKNELRKIHKKKNEEMWNSGSGMIGNKMTILNSGRSILKEKHIFMGNKNTSKIKKDRMFFK